MRRTSSGLRRNIHQQKEQRSDKLGLGRQTTTGRLSETRRRMTGILNGKTGEEADERPALFAPAKERPSKEDGKEQLCATRVGGKRRAVTHGATASSAVAPDHQFAPRRSAQTATPAGRRF